MKVKMQLENVISNLKTVSKTQCPSSKRNDTLKNVPVPQSRKWIEKNKLTKSKTGRLCPDEEVAITEALCEYAFESGLTGEELLSLITDKQVKSDASIWPKVAECLPDRSVQSIHNFCHRKFHPFNFKGGWTESEIRKLLVLVKEYGKKWETIGKTLERTATNVKDKFKEIGGFNYQTIVKESNLGLRLKLLKAIDYFLDNPTHILKFTYKFASALDKDFGVLFKLDESANKFLIDSSLKEETSKVIIRNIFKMILDFDFITKVYESEIELPWSAIADRIKFYSAEDCRKEWYKFLKEFDIEERCGLKKDYKMIKKYLILYIN